MLATGPSGGAEANIIGFIMVTLRAIGMPNEAVVLTALKRH